MISPATTSRPNDRPAERLVLACFLTTGCDDSRR